MTAAISAALATLTPRERTIVTLRFGFDDSEGHSLQAIGDRLKLTRERVRVIEGNALRKLAHPARGLRPLLEELED